MKLANFLFGSCFGILLFGQSIGGKVKPKADAKIVCNEAALQKADLCAEKLFFVGKNARLFPSNESEAEKYCSQTQQLVQCVKTWTDKCARSEITRNLANVMLYTVRSHSKGVCGSKTKRGQMVMMSACANAIRKKSNQCMEKMLVEFGQSLGLKELRHRAPYGCCAFYKMRACILSHAEKVDPEVCSSKATAIFDQYIGSMAGNTIDFLCTDADPESDRCTAIMKLPFDASKAKTPKSIVKAFGDLIFTD